MAIENTLIQVIDEFLAGRADARAPEEHALGERINRLLEIVSEESAALQKREAELQRALIHMRRVATTLMQGDLEAARIETDRLPSNLRPVGQAFNSLLDKIQELLKGQEQAKAELEHERNYWQELIEASQSGMAVFDPNGRVWEVNETLTEMFGYSKEEILDPGFSWARIIAPEDLGMAMERLKELLEKGIPQKFELTFLHKSGHKVPTLIAYDKLTRRPGWETDRMIASIQDITELKAQQEYVNALLGLLPVGMYSFDLETAQILSASPRLQDLLGYTQEELIQKTPFELLPKEFHKEATERIQRTLMTGERDWLRWRMLKKDGSRLPVMISYGKVYDPCIHKDVMAAFVVDISESERAMAFIERAVEIMPVGFLLADVETGRCLESNEAFLKMTDYSMEELSQKSWIDITPQEMAAKELEENQRLKAPEGVILRREKEFLRKDGTRVPVILYFGSVFDPRRQENVYLVYAVDITPLKEAQAKLEELVEAQHQTIKELSTPVIPVWTKVLMSPLLGSFDSMRMHDLSERLLEETARQKPRAVLLDLSGLAHVDTQVVSEIVRLITSVKLLGTRTALSGIGPQIAQSLVRLGVNLEGITTYSTLEQALRGVIGEVNRDRV